MRLFKKIISTIFLVTINLINNKVKINNKKIITPMKIVNKNFKNNL